MIVLPDASENSAPAHAPAVGEQRTVADERRVGFDHLPSAVEIMHWFIDKQLAREWVGCGGDADYILSDRCHMDLLANVDHDDRWYWLLSIGTRADDGTRYGGEPTYDLLFVAHDLDGKRVCEWRNQPSPEQPWHYEGLVWFAGQIESFEGRSAW